jgi:predicted nucleic acid-binding protein
VSGIKFLLDTNIVIGLVKNEEQVMSIFQGRGIVLEECAYSFVTRIELLSFSAITEPEIQSISGLLKEMLHISTSLRIEDAAINIRRRYKLKTPDAIISATAKVMNLELLTLDRQVANRMVEILEQQ